MFDHLTTAEQTELAARLWRAGSRFDAEYLKLSKAPRHVNVAYGLCPGGRCQCPERQHLISSDWLMAAIDCFRFARELEGQAS